MRKTLLAGTALAASLGAALGHSRYLEALPHGSILDRTYALRGLGHKSVTGHGQLNWFGFQFAGMG